jgi:hypothetical protein
MKETTSQKRASDLDNPRRFLLTSWILKIPAFAGISPQLAMGQVEIRVVRGRGQTIA